MTSFQVQRFNQDSKNISMIAARTSPPYRSALDDGQPVPDANLLKLLRYGSED
ncbi:hypothetical protein EIP91_007662, partial [Steccherinum ochraceum]